MSSFGYKAGDAGATEARRNVENQDAMMDTSTTSENSGLAVATLAHCGPSGAVSIFTRGIRGGRRGLRRARRAHAARTASLAFPSVEEFFAHFAEFLALFGGQGAAHGQAEVHGRFFLREARGADFFEFAINGGAVRSAGGEQFVQLDALDLQIRAGTNPRDAEIGDLLPDLGGLLGGDSEALADGRVIHQAGEPEEPAAAGKLAAAHAVALAPSGFAAFATPAARAAPALAIAALPFAFRAAVAGRSLLFHAGGCGVRAVLFLVLRAGCRDGDGQR